MLTKLSPRIIQQQQDRANFVARAAVTAKIRENVGVEGLSPGKKSTAELKNLCLTLHYLAQKHVPNTAQDFQDFNSLVQATHSLKHFGIAPPMAVDMIAPLTAICSAAATNSAEYRDLRNKTVAALATIADLTAKSAPPGDSEFQRGAREGYRRASDIAVLFLEDIQAGVK